MKKLIVFICFIFLSLPVFAEYKPIPANLSKQYKADIEKTINQKVYPTKIKIDNVYNEVKNEKDPIIQDTLVTMGIQTELFYFYMDLINTTEKYAPIKESLPETDFWCVLSDTLKPYLADNNINTSHIDVLINYAEKKQLEIERDFK